MLGSFSASSVSTTRATASKRSFNMNSMFMVALIAVFASAASSPLVYTYVSPFVGPSYSAALVAPEVVSPAVGPVVAAAPYPLSSVSAYSYGSSYSIQDYPFSPVAGAPVAAYSLPYAADWYYRK